MIIELNDAIRTNRTIDLFKSPFEKSHKVERYYVNRNAAKRSLTYELRCARIDIFLLTLLRSYRLEIFFGRRLEVCRTVNMAL